MAQGDVKKAEAKPRSSNDLNMGLVTLSCKLVLISFYLRVHTQRCTCVCMYTHVYMFECMKGCVYVDQRITSDIIP